MRWDGGPHQGGVLCPSPRSSKIEWTRVRRRLAGLLRLWWPITSIYSLVHISGVHFTRQIINDANTNPPCVIFNCQILWDSTNRNYSPRRRSRRKSLIRFRVASYIGTMVGQIRIFRLWFFQNNFLGNFIRGLPYYVTCYINYVLTISMGRWLHQPTYILDNDREGNHPFGRP